MNYACCVNGNGWVKGLGLYCCVEGDVLYVGGSGNVVPWYNCASLEFFLLCALTGTCFDWCTWKTGEPSFKARFVRWFVDGCWCVVLYRVRWVQSVDGATLCHSSIHTLYSMHSYREGVATKEIWALNIYCHTTVTCTSIMCMHREMWNKSFYFTGHHLQYAICIVLPKLVFQYSNTKMSILQYCIGNIGIDWYCNQYKRTSERLATKTTDKFSKHTLMICHSSLSKQDIAPRLGSSRCQLKFFQRRFRQSQIRFILPDAEGHVVSFLV